MNLTKEHMNTYKEYMKSIDEAKKVVKSTNGMKNRTMKLNRFATNDEIFEIEGKKELECENPNIKKNVKIYKFSNGDIYVGIINGRSMDGRGCYQVFKGNEKEIYTVYTGEFKKSKKHGKGEYKFSDGKIYTGEFDDDLMNGIGSMMYDNGDEYVGNWKDGKREGYGIYLWNNNYVYVGEYKDNKMDGFGVCYNNKDIIIYVGQWKNSCIHGKGKYIWGNGKKYEGEFFKGKKHGRGIFYLNDELIYDGTWKFDKPSIFGKSFDEIFAVML